MAEQKNDRPARGIGIVRRGKHEKAAQNADEHRIDPDVREWQSDV